MHTSISFIKRLTIKDSFYKLQTKHYEHFRSNQRLLNSKQLLNNAAHERLED